MESTHFISVRRFDIIYNWEPNEFDMNDECLFPFFFSRIRKCRFVATFVGVFFFCKVFSYSCDYFVCILTKNILCNAHTSTCRVFSSFSSFFISNTRTNTLVRHTIIIYSVSAYTHTQAEGERERPHETACFPVYSFFHSVFFFRNHMVITILKNANRAIIHTIFILLLMWCAQMMSAAKLHEFNKKKQQQQKSKGKQTANLSEWNQEQTDKCTTMNVIDIEFRFVIECISTFN